MTRVSLWRQSFTGGSHDRAVVADDAAIPAATDAAQTVENPASEKQQLNEKVFDNIEVLT